jgi:hypothetical protein
MQASRRSLRFMPRFTSLYEARASSGPMVALTSALAWSLRRGTTPLAASRVDSRASERAHAETLGQARLHEPCAAGVICGATASPTRRSGWPSPRSGRSPTEARWPHARRQRRPSLLDHPCELRIRSAPLRSKGCRIRGLLADDPPAAGHGTLPALTPGLLAPS